MEHVGTCSSVTAVGFLYEFVAQLMFVTSLSTVRLLGCGAAEVTALAQVFSSEAPLFAFAFATGFLTGPGAG